MAWTFLRENAMSDACSAKTRDRRWLSRLVRSILFGLFVAGLVTPQLIARADAPCDPETEFCVLAAAPSTGSIEGGANIGSTQTADENGNPYEAATYNPNARTTITHTGYEFNRYQTVPYVEFDGTQFIDTGIEYLMSDDTIKMEMDVEYTNTDTSPITGGGTGEQLTGFRSVGAGANNYLWRFFISMYVGSGNGHWATVGDMGTGYGVKLGTISTARKTLGVSYSRTTDEFSGFYNGALMGTKPSPPPDNLPDGRPTEDVGPLYLGAAKDNTARYFSHYKVYGFTIEKNGVIVADYTPTWDIITQKYGMLDEVSGEFFVSADYGPDLTGSLVDINGDPVATTVTENVTVTFSVDNDLVGTCDSPLAISNTQITCIPSPWDDTIVATPTESQLVDVNLEIATQSNTLADAYTYRAPMVVDAVHPNVGPVTGGQAVLIDGRNFLPPDTQTGYTLLEYVQFTGTQFIDTDVRYLLSDASIKMTLDAAYMDVSPAASTGNNEQLTGFRSTNVGTWRFFISLYNGNIWTTTGGSATTNGISFGATAAGQRRTVTLEHVRAANTSYSSIDGGAIRSMGSTAPTFNLGPIYLGTAYDNAVPNKYFSKYRVYGFTIEKNGVVVADYYPVLNNVTGLYGFLNAVTGAFMSNGATTGAPLQGGPEIGVIIEDLKVTVEDKDGPLCYIDQNSTTNTDILCITPQSTVGTKNMLINNSFEIITMVDGYTYAPMITSVNTPNPGSTSSLPVSNVGLTTGGNTLTIRGDGFSDGTPTVMVGDVACGNVIVVNATTLTCVIPPQNPKHATGTVDVVVTVNGVESLPMPTDAADDYVFRDPMEITSISPEQGSVMGGTTVTIVGTNLRPPDNSSTGMSVVFDPLGTPAACSVSSWTNTQIVCTTTAHGVGMVDVRVTNAFEYATKVNGFSYVEISLSISTTMANINLTAPGAEGFASTTYGVKTNSAGGYILSIRADDLDAGTVDDAYIKATSSCTATGARFAPIPLAGGLFSNTWGWKVSNAAPTAGQTDWKPMTLLDQMIGTGTTPTGAGGDGTSHDYYDVYFGAKSDYTQPACTYQNQVVVTAVMVD